MCHENSKLLETHITNTIEMYWIPPHIRLRNNIKQIHELIAELIERNNGKFIRENVK